MRKCVLRKVGDKRLVVGLLELLTKKSTAGRDVVYTINIWHISEI